MKSNSAFSKINGFLSKNAMLVVLILAMLFFEVLIRQSGKTSLFGPQSLTNLISQNGYVVILAVGMLMCILTGGNIDLAVGSIVALVGALAGVFIVRWGLNPYLGVVLCLLTGLLIGAWQAFWIAYVGIPPFIVTLSGMLTFRGLALFILGGRTISPFPIEFNNLFNNSIPTSWLAESNAATIQSVSVGIAVAVTILLIAQQIFSRMQKIRKGYQTDNLGVTIAKPAVVGAVMIFSFSRLGQYKGVPMLLVLLAVIILIYSYFTQNTIYGRYLYAMGGNEKAARLSGINTKRMMFFAYTNMGLLASVAAMVCVARTNSASTQAGEGYELDAIASCFIGGASAYGGIGTVGGAVIGAAFMGVLNMGMSFLGWDQNLQRVIKGLVLLIAVLFDVISKMRKQAAMAK